ncbi:hypothetical protein HZH68_014083 [Vespula germanica]|uniref:Uncharacterized protein n=1 Tax=Vespula germanica TaxID=30212 RepID=A0A834J9K0_VESGE|nr:hypothetical protein HZH68_014083 [Vespula germanica]
MPVTRVPTVFHPDGGGCDVNDEINHSKLSSDQWYQSELNCDTITTTTTVTTTIATTVKSNIATSAAAATTTTTTTTACSRAIGAQSRKRNHYAFVTFLRINMTAVIIGIIGVFVVQFAGTLGISNKEILDSSQINNAFRVLIFGLNPAADETLNALSTFR